MTRQDILNSLSDKELYETVADRLVDRMKQEAEEEGLELSDYDIDSFYEELDSFGMDVTNAIVRKLK